MVKGQLGRFPLLLSFKHFKSQIEVHTYPQKHQLTHGINLDLNVTGVWFDLRLFWEFGHLKVLRLIIHRLVQQLYVAENHPCMSFTYDQFRIQRKLLFKLKEKIRRRESRHIDNRSRLGQSSILGWVFVSVANENTQRTFLWGFIADCFKANFTRKKKIRGQNYYVPVTFGVSSICILWDILFLFLLSLKVTNHL